MTTYNTQNPLGSSDPRDLYDNAENLDTAVNSDEATFTDRLGKSRLTVQGMMDAATTGNPAVGAAQEALASADRAEAQADRAELEVAEGINTGVSQVTDFATAEADRAEAARDAAFVNADVYPDVAAGLSGTAEGEQFQVLAASGDEFIRYRHDAGGAAFELPGKYPESSSVASAAADALKNELWDVAWLDPSMLSRTGTVLSGWNSTSRPHHKMAAKAIKGILIQGADPSKRYRISIFANNDSSIGDRITISNAADFNEFLIDLYSVDKNPDGITKVVARDGGVKVTLWIDYREITEQGVLVNGVDTPFLIAKSSFQSFVLEQLEDSIAGVEYIGNSLVNPTLDPQLPESSFFTVGSAQVNLSAPMTTELVSRGVKRVASLNDVTGAGGIYKTDKITASDAGRYALAAVYVETDDASKWPGGFTGSVYNSAGSSEGAIGGSTFYDQITPTVRRYWRSGTIPNSPDIAQVRLGFATRSSDIRMGGFHLFLSDEPIIKEGVAFDYWYAQPFAPEWVHEIDERSKSTARDLEALEEIVGLSPSAATTTVAPRALRVSVAGSSITWGIGYLEQGSYLNGIDSWLRNTLATSVNAADMLLTGNNTPIVKPTFRGGSAVKLSGVGASAEFELYGDEMSAVIARERGNAGAAMIDLYVDDVLYDTFTTFNDEPFEVGLPISFTGDGATRKFDLGRAHTFGHVVSIDGVEQSGGLYTGGYGGTFPAGDDYLVIKQMVSDAGVPTVRHFLYFRTAPEAGTTISGSFNSGESISYMRGFIGNVDQGLDSAQESAYGDGNTAYDPENPAALSSGLGFRQSDERAVKQWAFTASARRKYRFVIAGLDARATGTTPELFLNFATNRMHHLQNAGIGGWTAAALRSSSGINNYRYVNEFEPDVIILESCTNEDRGSSTWQGYRTLTGLTDAEVRQSDSANYYKSVTYVGPDDYTVQDARLVIESIGKTSMVIDGSNATFDVAVGDVLIIGEFKGDNRRVVCRVVTGWDAGTRTATWGRPLSDRCVAQISKLDDLVGAPVMVKRSASWETAVRDLIDLFREANPQVQILLGTSGPPNLNHRNLEGYRELAGKVAADTGCGFVDFYGQALNWVYTTPPDTQVYLNASQSTVATGAARYQLFSAEGNEPSNWLLRVESVKVNGVERLNQGCYVEGGYKYGWADTVAQMSKANSTALSSPHYLVFTDSVPPAGAQVEVMYGSERWAVDDCHPREFGRPLFGQAAVAGLHPAAQEAFRNLGMMRIAQTY